MKQHIVVVLGTRPESIKQAPVIHALRRRGDRFRVTVISTGQHREMLRQMLPVLGFEPDIDLDLMRPNQTLADLTARCLGAVDAELERLQPDAVIVQGDTTTAMAAGLAAFYRHIPVGHVEAGLRSHSMTEPFPEEANRRVVDLIAQWLWTPTEQAARFLRAEGVDEQRISVTGNTVVDALRLARDFVSLNPPVIPDLPAGFLENGQRLVLITCHRRESFGAGIAQIGQAIGALADRFPDVNFVYPVHLNPNVKGPMHAALGTHDNVVLIEPVGYGAFVSLLAHAHLVLTDSGGVQEEAPSFGVPVVVMRARTERPEGVEAGCAMLVGSERAAIVEAVSELLTDEAKWRAMAIAHNPYGDGQAGERIAASLEAGLWRQQHPGAPVSGHRSSDSAAAVNIT
ncbi:MAG: UDP-N-acetylglucosamine 2-epimerase (non-hydrolyzing) [Myxococcales bacterium]|nr:UDP-N-acetylglucosamine 2-epimerase (non-hydrolyzing) [Myxococcales bacterium]